MAAMQGLYNTVNVSITGGAPWSEVGGSSATLDRSFAMGSTNKFNQRHNSRLPTLKDAKVTVSGPYDSSDPGMAILEAASESGDLVTLQMLSDGSSGKQGDFYVESFGHPADVDGIQQFSVSLAATSALTNVAP